MPRLIILLTLLLIAALGYRWFKRNAKKMNKGELFKLVAGVLLLTVVILALTGRLHWIAVLFAALIPLLRNVGPLIVRFFPLLQQLYKSNQPKQAASGKQSTVNTRYLVLHLNHDTGELEGEILEGPHKGLALSKLQQAQLADVLRFYQENDAESAQLLTAYLQKRFGDAFTAEQQHNTGNASHAGDMRREEALAILGLEDPVEKEAIIAAHRKLMQKLHPDRGGNDYLAAKVNTAKDTLL